MDWMLFLHGSSCFLLCFGVILGTGDYWYLNGVASFLQTTANAVFGFLGMTQLEVGGHTVGYAPLGGGGGAYVDGWLNPAEGP